MPGGLSFYSQVFVKMPVPTKSFAGQTVIVTGSNTGMGLEAAHYFVRLGAEKVIIAVRSRSKGDSAKISIEESEKRTNVAEVWELDLARYASVKTFAEKAKALERLDVVICNAGMYSFSFAMAEDNERTITVNVISTFLLGIMLLPKLRETSVRFKKEVVLTFTGSFVHNMTKFPERQAENIFDGLAIEKDARMNDRYNVSKMIQLLCVRELAASVAHSSKPGDITVSLINPGFVKTEIMREASPIFSLFVAGLAKVYARTPEEGGRILVSAAEGGKETHGQYLDDCMVGNVSDFVKSEDGATTQKKVWKELKQILEQIQPGVLSEI